MRESGWIYKPFERMGVMMGILSIAPQYSHSHISEIFEVIKTRRLNPKFLSMFGDSFRGMLKDYIENRRALLNASDRTSMRELAEAIAIELLLTADGEFDLTGQPSWTIICDFSHNLRKTDGQATSMALRSFAGINDTPHGIRMGRPRRNQPRMLSSSRPSGRTPLLRKRGIRGRGRENTHSRQEDNPLSRVMARL